MDCSIHDIDLALWFFSAGGKKGEQARPKSAMGVGICAIEPQLAQYGDVDNAVGLVEFWGGRVAYFYASRMMAAGQEDTTEIVGTAGKLTVGLTPRVDHVEVHSQSGVTRQVPPTFFERFEAAFVREAEEWVGCCLDGREVPVPLEGAVMAVEIGGALQESLRTGRKIWWDEQGRRVERAGL